jgi:hypothetical protein
VAGEPPAPLDLSRPRVFGELLSTTFQVFGRHSGVLLTAALLLITPVALLVDGVWGRVLADGVDAKPSRAAEAVELGLRVFVVLPLLAALSALVVQELGAGRTPQLGDALRAAARRFPAVLGAVGLYLVGVAGGVVLLVVPGIWLLVLWYFAPQAAAVEGLGPVQALRRSTQLVRGRWWRTAGLLLATGVSFAVGGSFVLTIVGSIGSTGLYVAGLIVVEAVVAALTTVFAALLLFDLRARRERPSGDGA